MVHVLEERGERGERLQVRRGVRFRDDEEDDDLREPVGPRPERDAFRVRPEDDPDASDAVGAGVRERDAVAHREAAEFLARADGGHDVGLDVLLSDGAEPLHHLAQRRLFFGGSERARNELRRQDRGEAHGKVRLPRNYPDCTQGGRALVKSGCRA